MLRQAAIPEDCISKLQNQVPITTLAFGKFASPPSGKHTKNRPIKEITTVTQLSNASFEVPGVDTAAGNTRKLA